MRGELGAEARFQQSPGRTEEAVFWAELGQVVVGGRVRKQKTASCSLLSSSSAVTGRREGEARG